MASRARFETNQGLLAFSRGSLTLRNGDTGVTKTYITVGEQFAPLELTKWTGKRLSVEVYLSPVSRGMTEKLDFEILKTPREIREESLKVFAPAEHGRLRSLISDSLVNVSSEERPGSVKARDEAVSQARETLAAFEKKYAKYLPRPDKKDKKSRKKTKTEKS